MVGNLRNIFLRDDLTDAERRTLHGMVSAQGAAGRGRLSRHHAIETSAAPKAVRQRGSRHLLLVNLLPVGHCFSCRVLFGHALQLSAKKNFADLAFQPFFFRENAGGFLDEVEVEGK
jgi:hypothetical protein